MDRRGERALGAVPADPGGVAARGQNTQIEKTFRHPADSDRVGPPASRMMITIFLAAGSFHPVVLVKKKRYGASRPCVGVTAVAQTIDFAADIFPHLAVKQSCKHAFLDVQVIVFIRADLPLNNHFSPVLFADFTRAKACGRRSGKCTFWIRVRRGRNDRSRCCERFHNAMNFTAGGKSVILRRRRRIYARVSGLGSGV